jgi:FdhD protein
VDLLEQPAQVEHPITRVRDGEWAGVDDVLAVEEPMEIRLEWLDDGAMRRESIAITMRTPGDDFELATGFLRGEGIIKQREDYVDVSYCLDVEESQELNVVTVTLRPGLEFDMSRLERHFYTTSSCGICGKAALDALDIQGCRPVPSGFRVADQVIRSLPRTLREAQSVFRETGGIHASGLFDADGSLLDLREDVGRHNALDKLIGRQFMQGSERLHDRVLLLSGRASFELVQKALMAEIPIVVAVGAPSSLAVDLARSFNLTLAGFVRPNGFNIYTGEDRIVRQQ